MCCIQSFKAFPALLLLAALPVQAQISTIPASIKQAVDQTIPALMQQYQIPGMSVAVTVGKHSAVLNYGVASKETGQPVSDQTLFEIGSVSKTFAATLASFAQLQGKLAWTDSVSQHLPALKGGYFDQISLLNLATHTSGLPMQTPDHISTQTQFIDYLKAWTPPHAIGTHRIYSNNGIGLLGQIAAQSLQDSYESALLRQILRPLGMQHTFITIPRGQMQHYAQGYTSKGQPIRMQAGLLSAQAYGIKTNSTDLLNFVRANIVANPQGSIVSRAIANTQQPYYQEGDFTQALIWDQYPYPIEQAKLMQSNDDAIVEDLATSKITQPTSGDILLNKTGSTNGFSSYIAYVPRRHIGVVLLANKSYPITARVKAGHQILQQIAVLDTLIIR